MCKNAGRPKIIANTRMNHMLKYYEECAKRCIVPLPILFKVRNKYLLLQGYRLNSELCQSLEAAFAIYPEILTGINLTNNGISDGDLARTLSGLTKLDQIKQIVIKENIVMDQSCAVLAQILSKAPSDNLEELRLVNIRTSPYITSRICGALTQGCYLRKLSLA